MPGPAEGLIGQYLRLHPGRRSQVQLLSKLSFIGVERGDVSRESVEFQARRGVSGAVVAGPP